MKFSVVTALKDGFAEFAQTLPTMLAQTHAEFEWILVDDGSARPLAESFPQLARDPRVRVLRLSPGQGQTKALNRGILEARGDWIVRMDGDDLAAPERLAAIEDALRAAPGAVLVFSDYAVIDEENRAWATMRLRRPVGPAFYSYLQARNNPICHPTTAFRRLKSTGQPRLYREDLTNAQDYALWKEILAEHGPAGFLHLPRELIQYRIARNSLSGARAKEQKVELEAIRENRTLAGEQSRQAVLLEPEKVAMQSYRLLYYRLAGHPAPASLAEDLALLARTAPLKGIWLRALLFLLARPLRPLLKAFLFGGIYE